MEFKVQFSSVAQSCLTLCDPMDYSPSGSSVHGFSRQEYWSGLPFPLPGYLPNPRIKPASHLLHVFCIGRWVLYHLCHLGSGIRELKVMKCFQLKILEEVKVYRIRVLFPWGPVQIPKEVTED